MRNDSPLLKFYYNKLPKYGPGGSTKDGCPPYFTKNSRGECVPSGTENLSMRAVADKTYSQRPIIFDSPTDPNAFNYDDYYNKANAYLSRPIFKNTPLTAKAISDAAQRFYNKNGYVYPIDLLLTQGQMETGLGTRLKSKNNFFNVGNTDDNHVKRYNTPDDSIYDYMDLIYNDYLLKGERSVDDLLKPKGFVNKEGDRYASSPTYETELADQRQFIQKYLPKQYGGLTKAKTGLVIDCPEGFSKNAFGVCVNAAGQTPNQVAASKGTLSNVGTQSKPMTQFDASKYKTTGLDYTNGRTPTAVINENVKADEVARQKAIEKKQTFISQGKASTPESEAKRIQLNKQYAAQQPNAQVDANGNLSAVNPNMTMTGEPANFMGERQQKGYEHIMGALDAAGKVMGVAELGAAGYKFLNAVGTSAGTPEEIVKIARQFNINPDNPTVTKLKTLAQYGELPLLKSENFIVPNDPRLNTVKGVFGQTYSFLKPEANVSGPLFNLSLNETRGAPALGKTLIEQSLKTDISPKGFGVFKSMNPATLRMQEAMPLGKPYTGTQAFNTISPNKYGGEIKTLARYDDGGSPCPDGQVWDARGNISIYDRRAPRTFKNGGGDPKYPINLNLPKYIPEPKSFLTGFGYGFSPQPNVNIYNVGAYGETTLSPRIGLSGQATTQSVFYPGGREVFKRPNYNLGIIYKFKNGGSWLARYPDGGEPDPNTNDLKNFIINWNNSPMGQQMLNASVDKDDPIGLNSSFANDLRDRRNDLINSAIINYSNDNDAYVTNIPGLSNSKLTTGINKSRNDENYGAATLSSPFKNPSLLLNQFNPNQSALMYNIASKYDPRFYKNNIDIRNINPFTKQKFTKDALSESIIHELSHASDFTGLFIPESDIKKMDLYAYGIGNWSPSRKKLSNFQKYIATPTETRARLMNFRYNAKNQGLYDPFTQKITLDQLNKYKPGQYKDIYSQGLDPLEQLREVYTDKQIVDLLNSVSKNDNLQQPLTMGKYGGWLNRK